MPATPRPTIDRIPTRELHDIAFEAFQRGTMATHDALIREHLRRKFAAEGAATAQADRRSSDRPWSNVATA
jgi:hypothetical protein